MRTKPPAARAAHIGRGDDALKTIATPVKLCAPPVISTKSDNRGKPNTRHKLHRSLGAGKFKGQLKTNSGDKYQQGRQPRPAPQSTQAGIKSRGPVKAFLDQNRIVFQYVNV